MHLPQTPVVVSQAGSEGRQSPSLQQWVALQVPPSPSPWHLPPTQLWLPVHCVLLVQGPHCPCGR